MDADGGLTSSAVFTTQATSNWRPYRPTSNFRRELTQGYALILMPITALIRFVDGSAIDHFVDDADLARLVALEQEGLTGKALIHAWPSDDWGAPPTDLTIHGVTPSGQHVNGTLFYD